MCKKCDQRRAEGQKFPTGSLVLCGPPNDRRKAVVVGFHAASATYGLVAWNKRMSNDDSAIPVANAIGTGDECELLDETDEALVEQARKYCRDGIEYWETWKRTPEGMLFSAIFEVAGGDAVVAMLTPTGVQEDPRCKAIAFLQRVDRKFIQDQATQDFEKALEEVMENILSQNKKTED